MDLISPTRSGTTVAKGNLIAFLAAFFWVMVGMTSASKSPFAIVSMTMSCLVFGWFLAATMIAHLTSGNGLVCERPLLTGEFHAQSRVPVRIRLENPSSRWPLLFLTAEILATCDNHLLRSPKKFLGMLPIRSAGEFEWHITARKRGPCQLHGLEAGTSFPGSLIKRDFFFAFDLPLLALPTVYRLSPQADRILQGHRSAISHQPSTPSAMEEFVGVRDYRPGDNPRNVSIALSLRMPDYPWQLVVREFQDPTDTTVCVVLDTSVPPGNSTEALIMQYRLEKSISFAVSLCRRLCEKKHTVRFMAFQPGEQTVNLLLKHPAQDIPKLERKLARLVPTHDPEAARRITARQERNSDAIVLLVALTDHEPNPLSRNEAVLTISPEWQASLVTEVVEA